ncbi:hypothetical protein D9M73_51810 [compost metagenome]|uniref:Uncharacterized protein n=1 Tax=Polaromonas aquatica TaxID=332657 RepID=A0ABW1TWC5_9BURK
MKLEQTIIKAARGELQRLRTRSSTAEDRDDALTAFQSLTALVMLAHIKDGGLSENAIVELLTIEKESSQAIRSATQSNSNYDPPLSQAGFMDLVCALQADLKLPHSLKILSTAPQAQREAALQVGAAAKNYVEVVEGRSTVAH